MTSQLDPKHWHDYLSDPTAPAERRIPKVELLPLAHPEYFPAGVKHRYTRT